jgi:hypothetical protein
VRGDTISQSASRRRPRKSARPTLERERRRAGLALPHRDAGGAFRRDVVAAWLVRDDRAVRVDRAYQRITRAALVLPTESARASQREISAGGRLSAHLNGGIRVVHGDVMLSKDYGRKE